MPFFKQKISVPVYCKLKLQSFCCEAKALLCIRCNNINFFGEFLNGSAPCFSTMRRLPLLLILCLAALVNSAHSANQHGAEVEDNDFAEFEEFDEGQFV